MADKKFLSVFTPSQTPPEDLEAIFVQRHELLADAVDRVRESAETDNKHHLLFAGPRGTGKTHFVTLLVHRLSAVGALEDKLDIAWLNEDETCTALLELLIKVFRALTKRYPERYPEEALEPAFDLAPDAALEFVGETLLKLRQGRTILIVMENLDALFNGLGDSGQKQLRAFIQEHPVFGTVATAQALVDDLTKRTGPFFGFFQTEHMQSLSRKDAATLLENIARQNQQVDVVKFLQTPRGRARIRALHHLSGGNHRIYVVLSQFISFDNIDALVTPFQEMVDKLTPYYQERIRALPTMQRKVVEYLCKSEGTVPVKEISRHLFASHQTISNQLKDLRGKGYVKSSQRGRESLYEVSEQLMRICVEVKQNQDYAPLRLLIDFVRVWYEDPDLDERLNRYEDGSEARQIVQAAREKNTSEGNLRQRLLIDGIRENAAKTLDEKQVERLCARLRDCAEELVIAYQCHAEGKREEALVIIAEFISSSEPRQCAEALFLRAAIYNYTNEVEKEVADYSAIIMLDDASPEQIAAALCCRAATLGQQGEVDKALIDYTAAIELGEAPSEQVAIALNNRGITHEKQGEFGKAIADYTSVVDLVDAPPEQVARALRHRGSANNEEGEVERTIADYTAAIELSDVPSEEVAITLRCRGFTHWQEGEVENALADYSNIIELDGAPTEQVVNAFIYRGLTYGQQNEIEKALADYTAAIEFDGAAPERVGLALQIRGSTYLRKRKHVLSLKDFQAVLGMESSISDAIIVDSHLGIAEIFFCKGDWDEGFQSLGEGLRIGRKSDPAHFGDIMSLLALAFEAGFERSELQKTIAIFVALSRENEAYSALGEALVHHLGLIHKSDDLPISDQLERWQSAWKNATEGVPEMAIPMRLFRTGIRFLTSKERDEAILLDLKSDDRELLRQALGLDE